MPHYSSRVAIALVIQPLVGVSETLGRVQSQIYSINGEFWHRMALLHSQVGPILSLRRASDIAPPAYSCLPTRRTGPRSGAAAGCFGHICEPALNVGLTRGVVCHFWPLWLRGLLAFRAVPISAYARRRHPAI